MTFTATVTPNAPGSGTPTGSVDFYDTTTGTDLTPGGVSLVSGSAAFATTRLATGTHTITAIYSGDGNFLTSSGSTGTVTIAPSVLVLNPSAAGALTLSGNAGINIPGVVVVDSSRPPRSRPAAMPREAAVIGVAGGVQQSGKASISPAPKTGVSLPDPLAGLSPPNPARLPNYGSVNLRGTPSDHLSRYLQPDQRLGQGQPDPEQPGQRHLHHRGGRLHGLRQRQRHRPERVHLQRRQQLPRFRW